MDDLARGRAERERLRTVRQENYGAKKRPSSRSKEWFTCGLCSKHMQILVCELPDGSLAPRCQKHIEGTIRPGQWNSR